MITGQVGCTVDFKNGRDKTEKVLSLFKMLLAIYKMCECNF